MSKFSALQINIINWPILFMYVLSLTAIENVTNDLFHFFLTTYPVSSQPYLLLLSNSHVELTFANAVSVQVTWFQLHWIDNLFINSPSVKGFDAWAIFSLISVLHSRSLILCVFDGKCCRKFSLFLSSWSFSSCIFFCIPVKILTMVCFIMGVLSCILLTQGLVAY